MAEHAHNTPTPRKQVDDAVYEIGVITDIISKLSTLMISSTEEVCGTSFEWLAKELAARHTAVSSLTGTGSFWTEA